MITYTWAIKQLFTVPQEAGHTDVVVQATWLLTGVEDIYSAEIGGGSQFTLQQGEGFTPYDQLTEQQVVDWVQQSLTPEGVEAMQNNVAMRIEQQKNPPPTPTPQPLPWIQE